MPRSPPLLLVEQGYGVRAPKHVGAIADREHDVVRCAETRLLPQLVGERLRPLREEGLPIVACARDVMHITNKFFVRATGFIAPPAANAEFSIEPRVEMKRVTGEVPRKC